MCKLDLYLGDCIEIMPRIAAESVNMVLVDPPYGTTKNKWDSIISLDDMWRCLDSVCVVNAAKVFTSSEPFTSNLIMSNLKEFRYDLIWEKTISSGQLNVGHRPLRAHENIVVFYGCQPVYNEQLVAGKPYKIQRSGMYREGSYNTQRASSKDNTGYRHARSVVRVSNPRIKGGHPTQKPVELMEILLKMYTNEGDTVLDFAMGSGTTGVACAKNSRGFVGIESDEFWFNKARERIYSHA